MKVVFIISAFLVSTSFISQPDCQRVKNGTFIIPLDDIEGMEGEYTKLQRKGGYQTETTSVNSAESRFTIKWIDDCTYLLFDKKMIKGENAFPLKSSDTLKVEIFNVTEEFYEAYVSSTFSDMKLEAKIFLEK